MALKKGVCKNFENCHLADNNEIQEVDSAEFRCTNPECGKELYEITDNGSHSDPTKTILIIVAAIILIGGGIRAYFGFIKDRHEKVEESVSLTLNKEEISLYVGESDTLKAIVLPENTKQKVEYMSCNQDVVIVSDNGIIYAVNQGDAIIQAIVKTMDGAIVIDSCKVMVSEREDGLPILQSGEGETPAPKQLGHSNLSFGTLDGSLSYDNNATIKVMKQHSMALKDAKQRTIVVCPGDELRQCRIRNGILESFQIISKNGNRESILDAQEKLN